MSDYRVVRLENGVLTITGRRVEKKVALSILRQGGSVYTNRSKAHSLAAALSLGQGVWRHGAHVEGGYNHYHDETHTYDGHIFYGEPVG